MDASVGARSSDAASDSRCLADGRLVDGHARLDGQALERDPGIRDRPLGGVAIPTRGEGGGRHRGDIGSATEFGVGEGHVAIGSGHGHGAFAHGRVGGGQGGGRLGFGHARQVHVTDADAGQDAPDVLLVVRVEGTDAEGHRREQADEERDAEAQRDRGPATGRRGRAGVSNAVATTGTAGATSSGATWVAAATVGVATAGSGTGTTSVGTGSDWTGSVAIGAGVRFFLLISGAPSYQAFATRPRGDWCVSETPRSRRP